MLQAEDSDIDDTETDVKAIKQNWAHQSLHTRHRMNLPSDATPWTADHTLTGLGKGNPRRVDAIDVAYWSYLIQNPDLSSRSSCPSWFVDASQGVERKNWGSRIPSLQQDSLPYSFQLDRLLDSEDRSDLNKSCF